MTPQPDDQVEPLAYPFTGAARLNLQPEYARLREEGRLVRVQPPYGAAAWLATRYEDVRKALSDPRFSRAAALTEETPRLVPFMPQPDTIIAMDPPEHTRLRRVVAQAFTMRRIERMRPRLQELVDGILDTFEKQGPPVDLVQMFALPVSAAAVCELLGVPFGDRDRFAAWIDLIMSSESTPDQVRHADAEQRSYLADLIALRREQPAEDLLTVLVETRDAGDQLTEEEMIALAGSVLVAGYMVTAVHMRNFVYALLADPDLNQQLREQPDLIPHAIEEMVRYIPPSIGEGLPRVATEDVELGGVTVRAGEAVLPSTMSANRDNAVFDAPDQMDVTRQDNPHLGFGFGVHRCVGAQLARVEMQVAIASLLARFPDLRLTTPASEVPYRTDTIWTGPEELQATW